MSEIDIKKRKSTDFTSDEVKQIYGIYEAVFHERRDLSSFFNQFCNTSKGYSYHAVALVNGVIVGHNVYVPFQYIKGEELFLLVLSIDAMILPDYQGKGIYKRLLKACEEMALADGCKIRIGFPNENSYPIQKTTFKYHDFGLLDTYFLPLKISKVKGIFKIFEPISLFISRLRTSKVSSDNTVYTPYCRRDRSSFDSFRYNWFGGNYKIVELEDKTRLVFKGFNYKGINALFLLDVFPLTRVSFEYACQYLVRNISDYSALIYVGKLPFKQSALFKVPTFLQPKKFHFVGKLLDFNFFDDEVFDINNWDINLSSFDLL